MFHIETRLDQQINEQPHVVEEHGEPEARTATWDGEEYVVTDVSVIGDEVDQVIKAERTVERNGGVVREATSRLALISKREFELLLETTGWSDWTGYGGFDGEPLDVDAQERG